MSQMTLNTDAVSAAVNQIDIALADIETRNRKFKELLDEKNAQTQGKFPLVTSLLPKVEKEAANLQNAIAAVESIKESIHKYTGLTEQATDTSWLGGNDD